MPVIADGVPLPHEGLEVLVHVGLELADALSGEGMGDSLAFPGVLSTIPGIEETTLNTDKGIVIITAYVSSPASKLE